MAWGAQQWLRVCKEATYGVVLPALDGGTATEGTDYWWVRLDSNNAFTPRRMPASYMIRSADGGNRRVQTGSNFYTVGGSLNTLFYPTRAALWLASAITLTANDLFSYTFDYFDTIAIRRFLGMKVAQFKITSEAQAQIGRLSIDLVGQSQDLANPGTFAAPAITNFPSETPYTHYHTKGIVKVNNVVRTKYSSLEVTVKNTLAATRDEDSVITSLFYAGRDVDWTLKSQYTATTDRAAFEGVTARVTNQVKWDNGTNTATLDLKSSDYIVSVNDELPLDNAGYQTLQVASLYDRSGTNDVAFSTT